MPHANDPRHNVPAAEMAGPRQASKTVPKDAPVVKPTLEYKFELAKHRFELSKTVLGLAILGLLAKVLHVDLSSLPVLGVVLKPESAALLLPGFVGIALIFALWALTACVLEAAAEGFLSGQTQAGGAALLTNRTAFVVHTALGAFSWLLYLMPFVMGFFATYLLWPDTKAFIAIVYAVVR